MYARVHSEVPDPELDRQYLRIALELAARKVAADAEGAYGIEYEQEEGPAAEV